MSQGEIITGFNPETGRPVTGTREGAVELGGSALEKVVSYKRAVTVVDMSERDIPIPVEQVTAQMKANALGSPYKTDEAGRIVPR